MARQCESLLPDGAQCPLTASWLIGVGTRQSDRQAACGRHFNQVCWALVSAEGRDTVMLSVTPLGSRWEAAREQQ